LSSDEVKFSGFDHLKLNGETCAVLPSGQAQVIIPNASVSTLNLVGYFDSGEAEYVEFNPVDYNKIFKMVIGSMDNYGMGNFSFSPAVDPKVVCNMHDPINTMIVETAVDGNITILVPSRVADSVEKGIVVNGMQIYKDWQVDPADQAGVNVALSAGYQNYKAYVNPYPAYAGTSVILNRYKL
jgi:hypothetical protein